MYAMQAISVNEFTAGQHTPSLLQLLVSVQAVAETSSAPLSVVSPSVRVPCAALPGVCSSLLRVNDNRVLISSEVPKGCSYLLKVTDRSIAGLAARWQVPYGNTTVGLAVLDTRGLFKENWWRWVGMAVLLGYAILFNILVLLAQTYLGREFPIPSEALQ